VSGVRIELRDVSFGYDETPTLDRLSLELPAGRVTAVVGPSGAGKTTLLRVIAGLETPRSGDVLFDGRSVLAISPERRSLGVVFQSYALFPHLDVRDNVAFGLVVRGTPRGTARDRVRGLLERLQIARLADRRPHQLSGGEKQRVALARALAIEPRALLLDEPLAALDAKLRLSLRVELRERLRAAGLTALYVTHDQQEAMELGDRVAIVRSGTVEQVGDPEEVYERPATAFVARFFGEANFLPALWDARASEISGPWGSLAVGAGTREEFGRSTRGFLMIRPESFRVGQRSPPRLDGIVRSVSYLGDRRRLVVDAGGTPLKVDAPATLEARIEDRVSLGVDLDRTVLLPEPSGETRGPGEAEPGEVAAPAALRDVMHPPKDDSRRPRPDSRGAV
jgi:putative spermidine/putrescine transport system ATP-binding protein